MKRLALVFLLACSKPTSSAPDDASTTTQAATASAPLEVDAGPPVETKVYRASGAKFVKGVLNECVDFTIRTSSATPTKGKDPLAKVREGYKKDGVTELQKPCGEQFADREALASCVAVVKTEDAGVSTDLSMTAFYFNVKTLEEDDQYMKECAEMGGAWKNDRNSAAWKKARLEQSRKNLQKAVDNLEDR